MKVILGWLWLICVCVIAGHGGLVYSLLVCGQLGNPNGSRIHGLQFGGAWIEGSGILQSHHRFHPLFACVGLAGKDVEVFSTAAQTLVPLVLEGARVWRGLIGVRHFPGGRFLVRVKCSIDTRPGVPNHVREVSRGPGSRGYDFVCHSCVRFRACVGGILIPRVFVTVFDSLHTSVGLDWRLCAHFCSCTWAITKDVPTILSRSYHRNRFHTI